MSRFESLANELLLDIFDYLTSSEILRLFFGLNSRLNFLLQHYLQHNALDFRSVKKKDFDWICQNILPSFIESVTRLHLSNDDDTPNQPNLFFSFNFHLTQFSSLVSLTLSSIHSIDLIEDILRQCSKLISLKLIDSTVESNETHLKRLIDQIWSMPKLEYCSLENLFTPFITFPIPQTTSSSIRYCSIQPNSISFDQFFDFTRRTLHLEHLQIKVKNCFSDDFLVSSFLSLKKLTLIYQDSLDHLNQLLLNLPNLVDLTIEVRRLYIDGEQWRQILSQTKIHRFQMLMNFHHRFEDAIDHILQSFSNEFWLNDRQWFVRCDVKSDERLFYVYTVPYAFPVYDARGIDQSKSTCPEKDSRFDDYLQVKRLIYSPQLSSCPFRFSSIHNLELSSMPIDDYVWSVTPRLDRLISLDIHSLNWKDDRDETYSLLNKTTNLSTLIIDCTTLLSLSTRLSHPLSLDRLNLIVNDGHFYGSDCIPLIQSLVANRCEVLLINIQNRQIVIELLEQFPSLRSLVFQSQDDQWGEIDESADDELMQWLIEHLPSTFSITRDHHAVSAIRIWIG